MTMTLALLGDDCASAEYPESSLSDETCCDSDTLTGEVAQPTNDMLPASEKSNLQFILADAAEPTRNHYGSDAESREVP